MPTWVSSNGLAPASWPSRGCAKPVTADCGQLRSRRVCRRCALWCWPTTLGQTCPRVLTVANIHLSEAELSPPRIQRCVGPLRAADLVLRAEVERTEAGCSVSRGGAGRSREAPPRCDVRGGRRPVRSSHRPQHREAATGYGSPGGTSLADLLARRRGHRNIQDLPDLSKGGCRHGRRSMSCVCLPGRTV
jgi:hypothetical protein